MFSSPFKRFLESAAGRTRLAVSPALGVAGAEGHAARGLRRLGGGTGLWGTPHPAWAPHHHRQAVLYSSCRLECPVLPPCNRLLHSHHRPRQPWKGPLTCTSGRRRRRRRLPRFIRGPTRTCGGPPNTTSSSLPPLPGVAALLVGCSLSEFWAYLPKTRGGSVKACKCS
jgi:hypothetical protein